MSDEAIEVQPATPPAEETTVVYNFTVKGKYPDGNRARMHGTLIAPDGFPFSAFDQAIEICKKLTPGLIVDQSKPGQVILKKKKAKR